MKMKDNIFEENYFLETNRKFFNGIGNWYDFFFGSLTLKMQRKIIKNFNIEENAVILDAGCGTGTLLSLLEASEKPLGLYGIDISEKMLNRARKKLKRSSLINSPLEHFNFNDKFFNYIFSIHALHHYFDPEETMKSFYLYLKQGGYLIIADFSFGSLLNRLLQKIEPGNNMFYLPPEMKRLFQKYRFQDIQQKKISFFTTMTYGRKIEP